MTKLVNLLKNFSFLSEQLCNITHMDAGTTGDGLQADHQGINAAVGLLDRRTI